MGRPKKLPANVIRLVKDDPRRLARAKSFEDRPHYFYRVTPPIGDWVIVEYSYFLDPQNLFYANGIVDTNTKKFRFFNSQIQDDNLQEKIKLLSWRLESEWHSGTKRMINNE